MPVEAFLDTNVLVYAAAGRGPEEAKRRRALDLIDSVDFGLSAQVLQEFYVTVVHKIPEPLPADEALEWIELLRIRLENCQQRRRLVNPPELGQRTTPHKLELATYERNRARSDDLVEHVRSHPALDARDHEDAPALRIIRSEMRREFGFLQAA